MEAQFNRNELGDGNTEVSECADLIISFDNNFSLLDAVELTVHTLLAVGAESTLHKLYKVYLFIKFNFYAVMKRAPISKVYFLRNFYTYIPSCNFCNSIILVN